MIKLRSITKINYGELVKKKKVAALHVILSIGSTSVSSQCSMDVVVSVRLTSPGGKCPSSTMT